MNSEQFGFDLIQAMGSAQSGLAGFKGSVVREDAWLAQGVVSRNFDSG